MTQQYIADVRKVKNHIFAYLKLNRIISNPYEVKIRECLREFEKATGVKIPKMKPNKALAALRHSPEFEPYLQYKPSKVKREAKERKLEYDRYIAQSPEWQRKRRDAFALYGRKCAKCKSSRGLQVHHKTYEHLFNEPMEDLMILCFHCHKEVHRKRLEEYFA